MALLASASLLFCGVKRSWDGRGRQQTWTTRAKPSPHLLSSDLEPTTRPHSMADRTQPGLGEARGDTPVIGHDLAFSDALRLGYTYASH